MTWPADSSDEGLTFRELYRRQVYAAYVASPTNDLLAMLEMLDTAGHIVFPDEIGYDEAQGPVVGAALTGRDAARPMFTVQGREN